ncbi:hypothetical protein MRX96_018611 [Rhipicephalus microplus]|uniref:4 kDa defensin-like n=1 Tax=Rhipicephalus microplus TaxID=6941 RepID=UPI0018880627|nr:4 kDa defensin-like [Rhipicephalus microplus]
MKFLGIALAFVLVAGLINTTVAQDGDSKVPHVRVRRGFGCPVFQGNCHTHCRSIGRLGGYCAGTFKLTCTCYRN